MNSIFTSLSLKYPIWGLQGMRKIKKQPQRADWPGEEIFGREDHSFQVAAASPVSRTFED